LLQEPYVLQQAALRIALVHGDAQCTDDAAYMAFRAQVRQPAWQAGFLGMPLAQRKKIIAGMRNDSKNAQREKTMQIMDVNQDAVITLFEGTGADVIIHGHTHRPARHALEHGTRTVSRLVLPDWDCEAEPAHGGWIRLESDGSLHRYDVRGNVVDWSSR
jgi:UDP-2,3-diacylglucosamine hydrolase